MNEISAAVQWALALFALVCSSEAGIIIKQMITAAKDRAAARKTSDTGHKTTHKLLRQLSDQLAANTALQEQFAAALAENSTLRAADVLKDRRIAKLEGERNEARAMLAALKKEKKG